MPATLSNLQRELLDLFSTDLSDDELREVRRVLARHFAGRATSTFDRAVAEKGLSPDDIDRWAYGRA